MDLLVPVQENLNLFFHAPGLGLLGLSPVSEDALVVIFAHFPLEFVERILGSLF